MEELFFLATDEPCTADWCAENLADTRALRDAGKFVLAVDYAARAGDVRDGLRAGTAPSGSPATSTVPRPRPDQSALPTTEPQHLEGVSTHAA